MFGAKFKPQDWLFTLSPGVFPADKTQEGTFFLLFLLLIQFSSPCSPFHTHLMRYPDWGLEAEDLCKEQNIRE